MLGVEDPGYDISIYGPFIEDIPRRLGRNEALDSAAVAWVAGYSCVRTREQTQEMYHACNDAVAKLRTCLNDPIKAVEIETICAVYMMMIFQVMSRQNPVQLIAVGMSPDCINHRAGSSNAETSTQHMATCSSTL
jgi:glutamate-1-semialdehyde aminotransferase